MIWLLGALLTFAVSALVAVSIGQMIAFGKHEIRRDAREQTELTIRDRRERHLTLCLTARDAAPADIRALERLARADRAPGTPHDDTEAELRAMVAGRSAITHYRDPHTGDEVPAPAGLDG